MIIKTFRANKDKLKIKELKSTLRSKFIKVEFKINMIKIVSSLIDVKYSVNKFILSKEKQFVENENRANES